MENFVIESCVLNKKEMVCFGNRKYAEIEIESLIDFGPGQYLMICTQNKETVWPYPYFLQRKTERGVVVLAESHQDLYESDCGDIIQYWGPRGTEPLKGNEKIVLATEPALCFAVQSFLEAGMVDKLLILGTENTVKENILINSFKDIKELAETVEKEKKRVVAAFNPMNVKTFIEHLSETKKEDVFLYVSNKKACGMDGCKGCYLHSKELKFGINVCCKGPFIPVNIIDFEKDGKSFETFI